MKVEAELYEIRNDETLNEHIVVLREKDGSKRLLPIVIGLFEAQSIELRVHGVQLPRPLTHDLLASVIQSLDGEVDHIYVSNLEGGTFFGRIYVRRGNDLIDIDSRPSDAIALAVRVGVPIFVEDALLEQSGPT